MSTRDHLMDNIALASARGRLGLFIGAGFSKALTSDEARKAADWRGLLEAAATQLDVSMPTGDRAYGMSFPQMASDLIDQIRERDEIKEPAGEHQIDHRRRATWKFKYEVANLCHFDLGKQTVESWRTVLTKLNPAWIVTTNFDLLIEQLLPNSTVLLPGDPMTITRNGAVPVFHMHGHRLVPNSLVITEEDYVHAIRPSDYRFRKLPLLFSESAVLFLGYALGDINVQSAIDLARAAERPKFSPDLTQVVWKPDGYIADPYRGRSGQTIIESDNLFSLLDSIGRRGEVLAGKFQGIGKRVRDLKDDQSQRELLAAGGEPATPIWRCLRIYSELHGNHEVLEAIATVLDELWSKAAGFRAFSYYESFVRVILDGFDHFREDAHPSIINLLADRLARVAPLLDVDDSAKKPGRAWAASELFLQRRSKLAPRLVMQLHDRARAQGTEWAAGILPIPGTASFPYWPQCPECGISSENLEGGQSTDDENDRQYYWIECKQCGWREDGEI